MGVPQSQEQVFLQSPLQQYIPVIIDRDNRVFLFDDKTSLVRYRLKELTFYNQLDAEACFRKALSKSKTSCNYLLRIQEVLRSSQSSFWNKQAKVYLLHQEPFRTLYDQFVDRSTANRHFEEEELESILTSVTIAMAQLERSNVQHQRLSLRRIFLDREGIPKVCDPILLDEESNLVKRQRGTGETHLYTYPWETLNSSSVDVFTFGMILLELGLLQHHDELYKAKFDDAGLSEKLDRFSLKYSFELTQVLKRMIYNQYSWTGLEKDYLQGGTLKKGTPPERILPPQPIASLPISTPDNHTRNLQGFPLSVMRDYSSPDLVNENQSDSEEQQSLKFTRTEAAQQQNTLSLEAGRLAAQSQRHQTSLSLERGRIPVSQPQINWTMEESQHGRTVAVWQDNTLSIDRGRSPPLVHQSQPNDLFIPQLISPVQRLIPELVLPVAHAAPPDPAPPASPMVPFSSLKIIKNYKFIQ